MIDKDLVEKIKASADIDDFFEWMVKTGQIEVLGKSRGNYRQGAKVWGDVRRTLSDEYLNYRFKGEDTIYSTITWDGSYFTTEYDKRLIQEFHKLKDELKENGEYYINGTTVPRHSLNSENGICYVDDESNKGQKNAIIVRDYAPCITIENVNSAFERFCYCNKDKCIYVSLPSSKDAYIKYPDKECVIENRTDYFRKKDEADLVHENNEEIGYFSLNQEIMMKKNIEDGKVSGVFHMFGSEVTGDTFDDEHRKKCLLLCDGNNIKMVLNYGSHGKEEIKSFEFEDGIHSLDVHTNYALVNGNEVIAVKEQIEYSYDSHRKISKCTY